MNLVMKPVSEMLSVLDAAHETFFDAVGTIRSDEEHNRVTTAYLRSRSSGR